MCVPHVWLRDGRGNPTREELAHGVSGNLCRCQDYDKILTALMRGAESWRGGRNGTH